MFRSRPKPGPRHRLGSGPRPGSGPRSAADSDPLIYRNTFPFCAASSFTFLSLFLFFTSSSIFLFLFFYNSIPLILTLFTNYHLVIIILFPFLLTSFSTYISPSFLPVYPYHIRRTKSCEYNSINQCHINGCGQTVIQLSVRSSQRSAEPKYDLKSIK